MKYSKSVTNPDPNRKDGDRGDSQAPSAEVRRRLEQLQEQRWLRYWSREVWEEPDPT